MRQMSESAVTFQGAELSQWPPVKSMRAENAQHPIEALSLLAH